MVLNPGELDFWARIVIVVVFALWGFYAAVMKKSKKSEDEKWYERWYKRLTFLTVLVALIVLAIAFTMVVFRVHWPQTFDYALLAAAGMWAPIVFAKVK